MIVSPVVRGRKGEFAKLLESLRKSGYMRIEVDGVRYDDGAEGADLDKNVKHTISVVVDRLIVKEGMTRRLTDSLETALKLSDGLAECVNGEEHTLYSTKYACPDCDISMEELTPRFFSFNSPYGACPKCFGLGFGMVPDLNKFVKWDKSLSEGAVDIKGWSFDTCKVNAAMMRALAKKYGFSLTVPFKDLPEKIQKIVLYGDNEPLDADMRGVFNNGFYSKVYEGVCNIMRRRYNETTSDLTKMELERFMSPVPCDMCHGKRLKKEALSVTVGGLNIAQLCDLPIDEELKFFNELKLSDRENTIAAQVIKEIKGRLGFMVNVGLDYLTLSRSSSTLSGGESQRIRLATQIGSGLTGVLYILDEPSIGLHQRDNGRLLDTLTRLRDLGNTLVVVEHDEETMAKSDFIVDIGPGAGVHGGEVVAAGKLSDIIAEPRSITGKYLSGELSIPVPETRRKGGGGYITVRGAAQNNLQAVDVAFPTGVFTAVTGVSGSGKSSLVNEVLFPVLSNKLMGTHLPVGVCAGVDGIENIDKVIAIDQSPIGRTPRSNPATYTNVFGMIRDLYAALPDAQTRGYKAGRFSFNVEGGRCENCKGDGIIKIEMHFLPDVYVPCEVCKGARYNRETLEVKYKGKSIAEVLDMTVEEALNFFANVPRIRNKIQTLYDVGLGYIKLGQSSTTLSGGEAQRVKLATELSRRSTGKTLYILDEPTTGLHSHDVAKLLTILGRLADSGNTIIVIEHNLDVIKTADYIVDLGPDGGDGGGRVIVCGTPEEVAKHPTSYTAEYLRKVLKGGEWNKD